MLFNIILSVSLVFIRKNLCYNQKNRHVLIVRGCEGQHPSDICSSAGYLNAAVTPNNLERITERLNQQGVESAYVAGWADHRGDYVLHCNGSVNPFDVNTNNTIHAVCYKEKKNCVKPKICRKREFVAPLRKAVKKAERFICDKFKPKKKAVKKRLAPVLPVKRRELPKVEALNRRKVRCIKKKVISPNLACRIVKKICKKPLKVERVTYVNRRLAEVPIKKRICRDGNVVKHCNRVAVPIFPPKNRCAPLVKHRRLNREKLCKKLLKLLCSKHKLTKERKFTCQEILDAIVKVLPHAYCNRNILEQLMAAAPLKEQSHLSATELKSLMKHLIPALKSHNRNLDRVDEAPNVLEATLQSYDSGEN